MRYVRKSSSKRVDKRIKLINKSVSIGRSNSRIDSPHQQPPDRPSRAYDIVFPQNGTAALRMSMRGLATEYSCRTFTVYVNHLSLGSSGEGLSYPYRCPRSASNTYRPTNQRRSTTNSESNSRKDGNKKYSRRPRRWGLRAGAAYHVGRERSLRLMLNMRVHMGIIGTTQWNKCTKTGCAARAIEVSHPPSRC